jgi:two-component system nitrogen regulation response regulator GlnG
LDEPEMNWNALAEYVESLIARGEQDVYRRALEHFDRLVVTRAIRQAGGQQSRAAEILGLSRVTLRAKLRTMDLGVEKVLTPRRAPQPG